MKDPIDYKGLAAWLNEPSAHASVFGLDRSRTPSRFLTTSVQTWPRLRRLARRIGYWLTAWGER